MKKIAAIVLAITMLATLVHSSPDTKVYVTETGSAYHRLKCSYLKGSCHQITLREAKRAGYYPCSRCKPPKD